jgi:glycosyltransferase involved in cell wall biosynthesis
MRIIAAAFGDPRSETTFSGVSKYLFDALEIQNIEIKYVSTKRFRPWDLANGALDFSKIFKYGRPGLSISWLWRKSTLRKLSDRFSRELATLGNVDTVLQIGTHVVVNANTIRHFCFTDMTIAQVTGSDYAKDFSAGRLSPTHIPEAIDSQKEIFESCKAIFVNSNWTRESIVNDYGIDDSKVHVVGAGVSLPLNSQPKHTKIPHSMVFIGRNWNHKGGPILLKAFDLVRKRYKDTTLTIVGCHSPIKDKNIKVLGLLDKCKVKDRKLLQKTLDEAHVLCVPSKFEAYGICFLEAQLHGAIPVTFAGEGRTDAIKDGITGVLVEQRTPEALSEAIVDLFKNPDKARKMAEAGKEFVTHERTWHHVASRILNVMRDQLA